MPNLGFVVITSSKIVVSITDVRIDLITFALSIFKYTNVNVN